MSQIAAQPRHTGMTAHNKQALAGLLALSAAMVGGWATIVPHSFYTDFPLAGHHWVSGLGPYNEHLVRDVGGLYLALFVLTAWAIIRKTSELLRVTGAAWAAFSLPHLLFHLNHLDGYSTFDKVGNVVSLGGTLVIAALLLLPTKTPTRPTQTHP